MIPRKRRQKEQGYDPSPPVCRNCKHFQRNEWRTIDGKRYYTPHKCVFGGFFVEPFGICDEWVGRDGSTLEPPENPANVFERALRAFGVTDNPAGFYPADAGSIPAGRAKS